MSFLHGKNSRVLYDGNEMSAYLSDIKTTLMAQLHDITVFGNAAKGYLPGLKDAKATFAGFWDPTATVGSDAVFQPGVGLSAGNIFTWSPGQGLTIGNKVQLALARESDYEAGAPVADVVKIAVTIQCDTGIDTGVSLHDLVAETATGAFASVNNLASSTNGGVGHINVTAFTGTSFTIKIQHSTDNTTFADLITFTVTATGGQRTVVAAGTTVNQYLRGNITAVSGATPSCTFNLAFARR